MTKLNKNLSPNVGNKTLLALAIGFACTAISSQTRATETEEIEVISVTATRSAMNIDNVLANQIVITREDISLLQPKSVLELVSSVAGIDITNNGSRGQNSSILVRGANSNHTLVLVNGLRVSSATLGSTNVNTIAPEIN